MRKERINAKKHLEEGRGAEAPECSAHLIFIAEYVEFRTVRRLC